MEAIEMTVLAEVTEIMFRKFMFGVNRQHKVYLLFNTR
uniref:Uncharacterized protein n=1 Tax=Anguilla anguilla TaxID=7936 RepID=A0A0E9VXH8_ANGAN